ncbi:MAG: tetratricopeptide repeat protein, partial [bacterium]|nr:tetratricopeptide repeat protein [bacterium]
MKEIIDPFVTLNFDIIFNSKFMVPILVTAVGALASLGLLVFLTIRRVGQKRWDYETFFQEGCALLEKDNPLKANQYFRKVIGILLSSAEPDILKKGTDIAKWPPTFPLEPIAGTFLESCRKALMKKQVNPTALQRKMEILALSLQHLGHIRLDAGDQETAYSYFNIFKKIPGKKIDNEAMAFIGDFVSQREEAVADSCAVYLESISRNPSIIDNAAVYAKLEAKAGIHANDTLYNKNKKLALNKKIMTVTGDLWWVHFNIGLGLALSGKLAAALPYFRETEKKNPGTLLNGFQLGKCLASRTEVDNEEAESLLKNFLQSAGTDEESAALKNEAAYLLGKLLVERHERADGVDAEQISNALEYFQQATGGAADSPDYFLFLGRGQALLKDYDTALGNFRKAAHLAPDNKHCYYHMGRAYRALDAHHEAAEALKKALQLDEGYTDAFILSAALAMDNKQYDEALRLTLQVEGIKGFDRDNMGTLVRVHYRRQQYKEVIEALERFGHMEPCLEAEARFCVGRAYLKTGAYGNACLWLKGLPEQPRNLYYLACALAHDQKPSEAVSLFKKTAATEQDFQVKALTQLGHLHLARADLTEAGQYYTTAFKKAPNDPEILSGIGCVFYNSGKLKEAAGYFSKCLSVAPEYSSAYYRLGLVYEKANRPAEAMANYEKAIATPPATRDGGPATRDGGPATRDGGPATQDGNPATQDGNPATQDGNPATQDGNPATQDGNFTPQGHENTDARLRLAV